MLRRILFLIITIHITFYLNCQVYGAFQDSRDGRIYKTVNIGIQIWMAENLNADRFQNGDPIPEAKTRQEWRKAEAERQPAWCYYNNDEANGEKYGKLYNWYAVNDPRGIAPIEWHVPSKKEYSRLINYLNSGEEAGRKMKSISGWESNTGTNSSGFSGLPGGYRYFRDVDFEEIGFNGSWWSSSAVQIGSWKDYTRPIYIKIENSRDYCLIDDSEWGSGFSVRCMKY
jgi:uncharacterized protein (TIGR02145 family)